MSTSVLETQELDHHTRNQNASPVDGNPEETHKDEFIEPSGKNGQVQDDHYTEGDNNAVAISGANADF